MPSQRFGRARWAVPSAASYWRTTPIEPVPEYLQSGQWMPRPSIVTLASAMDVGNPSNMERVRALYPTLPALREQLSAESVDDATIRARIGGDFMQYGREWCPHTATAAEVYSRLGAREARRTPMGIGGNCASGQVQRNRRTADRQTRGKFLSVWSGSCGCRSMWRTWRLTYGL